MNLDTFIICWFILWGVICCYTCVDVYKNRSLDKPSNQEYTYFSSDEELVDLKTET